MRIEIPELDGPLVLHPARFADERGSFSETWSSRRLEAVGIREHFVQDNYSTSVLRGTLRGMHFQLPPHAQAKLLWVPRGAVFDVIVDLRSGSPTFGAWAGIELSADRWNQLFVPRGFAHGFCTLQPDTHVLYKVSAHYCPEAERGLRWDDPGVAIDWPEMDERVIAERDLSWPPLSEMEPPFPATGHGGEP